MKKLALILFALSLCIVSFAQVGAVKTLAIDTLDNTDAKTSDVIIASGQYSSLAITALCTQLGGTSDGTLTLQGSVDGTSYKQITSADGLAKFYTADTHTITNGSVWAAIIIRAPWKYYKVIGTGTANDTTLVTIKYIFK